MKNKKPNWPELARQHAYSSIEHLLIGWYYTLQPSKNLNQIAEILGVKVKELKDLMWKANLPLRQDDWVSSETATYPVCPCCGVEFPGKKEKKCPSIEQT